MASKTFFLIGSITTEKVQTLMEAIEKQFTELPTDEITLVISSGGGSQIAGSGFFEWARSTQVPLTTIGVGYVGSMAVLIWLAGTRRRMSENTSVLIHDLSRVFDRDTTLGITELEAMAAEMRNDSDLISLHIAKASGQAHDKIKKLSGRETYLDVSKMIALGLLREEDVIPVSVVPTKELAQDV